MYIKTIYTHILVIYYTLFNILYIYISVVWFGLCPARSYVHVSFILAFISVLDSWTWECFGLSHAVHHQDGHFRIHRHPLQQSPKSLMVGADGRPARL